jgi:hypothetical protein
MTTITTIGREISHILEKENSIAKLISYFEATQLFDIWKALPRNDFLYNYQIPVDEWTRITGLERPLLYLYHVEYSDGALYTNCYFDADYRDNDSIDYLYVALNSSASLEEYSIEE